MTRLIDFSNFQKEKSQKCRESYAYTESSHQIDSKEKTIEFLEILLKQSPGKMVYSLKEVADVLGIGQEFIRRRVKRRKINSVKIGDKQVISVIELARILEEGVS